MATYAVVGSTLQVFGTNITTDFIGASIVASGFGSYTKSTTGVKPSYAITMAGYKILSVGSSTSGGPTADIWDCSNESVTIASTAATLSILTVYGRLKMGDITDGTSTSGGKFAFMCLDSQRFDALPQSTGTIGGIIQFYGCHVYHDNLMRVGSYSTITAVDCDLEIEDSLSFIAGAVGATIDVSRSRMHHTSAVGIRPNGVIVSPANTMTLASLRVEKCNWAIQPSGGTIVVADLKIDTCSKHIVANGGVLDLTILNPDFTVLRTDASYTDATDVVRLEFRYKLKVTDTFGVAISGSSARITDQQGSHRFDTITDVNGNPTTVPAVTGLTFPMTSLQHSTWAGVTGTTRSEHTLRVRNYNHIWVQVTRTATQDNTNDVIPLSTDLLVSQSGATAAAHTGISVVDNGGTPVTWNAKLWGITITGNLTTNPSLTAADIFHHLKYKCSLAATFNGKSGEDWHAMMPSLTTTGRSDANFYAGVVKGVRVIDQAGNAFPGFTSMQADDGSYYTPPATVLVKITAKTVALVAIQNARVRLIAAAGGPLTVGTVILSGLTDVNGVVQDAGFTYTSDQPVTGVIRKSTGSPLYKTTELSGSITAGGYNSTAIMLGDE